MCQSHGPAAAVLNRCTNTSLTAIGGHWAIALGGGVILGGAVGIGCVLVARALRATA